jgi:hypothetical protein
MTFFLRGLVCGYPFPIVGFGCHRIVKPSVGEHQDPRKTEQPDRRSATGLRVERGVQDSVDFFPSRRDASRESASLFDSRRR